MSVFLLGMVLSNKQNSGGSLSVCKIKIWLDLYTVLRKILHPHFEKGMTSSNLCT